MGPVPIASIRSTRSAILVALLGAASLTSLSRSPLAENTPGSISQSDADRPVTPASAPSEHEPTPNRDRPYWRTNLFKRVLTDQKYLVTSWWPQEFRRPAFAVPLLGTTVAALALQQRDEEGLGDSFPGSSTDDGTGSSGTAIAGDFTRLGNGPVAAALLGVTYLFSRHAGNDRLAETSSLSTESLIDAGIWIEVLKRAFARVRPSQVDEGKFFQYGGSSSNSFPSGHALGAFAVAAVFAEEYRDKRWMPWLAYGTATLIGASRVALGRHFPTDVVVGALIGDSIGRGVAARARGADKDRRRSWTRRLAPIVDPSRDGYGVAYSCAW